MKRAVVVVGGVEFWHPTLRAARAAATAMRAQGQVAFMFEESFYRQFIQPTPAH